MTTSHTPGPWIVSNNNEQVWSSHNPEMGRICVMENGADIYRQLPLKERQANALHIAKCVNAHPKLLAALKASRAVLESILGTLDEQPIIAEQVGIIDAVIAEGEQ